MVGLFEPAVGSMLGIELMVERQLSRDVQAKAPRQVAASDVGPSGSGREGPHRRKAAVSSGGEHLDDVLDRLIGAMVGLFESAVGSMFGVGLMVEAAIGERTAEAFVKEEEE